MSDSTTCLFCGSTGIEPTEEHLFPQWMSKLFRKTFSDDFIVSSTRFQNTWRARKFRDTMAGVCRVCNNERLSVLENRLKLALSELCLGTAKRITTADERDLRAWITRFAIATEYLPLNDDPDRFFNTAERRRFIETFEPPEDSWFWIAPMDARLRAAFTNAWIKTKSFGAYDEDSLVVTGVVGRLAFQFVSTTSEPPFHKIPVSMYLESLKWDDVHRMLWPNRESDLEWPTRRYLTVDGYERFLNRFGGEAVAPVVRENI